MRRSGWSGKVPEGGGCVEKSRQAVGTVPGSCQLSALTVSLYAQDRGAEIVNLHKV